jgi:hypothetical protein
VIGTTINPATAVAHHRTRRPLPVGLPTVDRILRGTLIPDAHGWLAVEAVTVALAGAEPWLTAPGGPLTGLTADVLLDPWHRDLWNAYGQLRATGDLVAPLSEDVLGATVAAAGCDDPAGAVTYLVDLWAAGWRDSLGVGVARALELLTGRAEYLRNAEALAAQGAALGLYDGPAVRRVNTPQDTPPGRVSVLPVEGTEAGNADTPPRPGAATPTGDAVGTPASGGEWCPTPVHRTRANRYQGRVEAVDVACERRTCPYCGPRWQASHLDPVVDALGDADAWRVVVDAAAWPTVLRRLNRAHADYKRVPVPNSDTVLVVSTVAVPGAERVAAGDVPTVLGDALAAVRTVPRVKVTASAAWNLATAERAEAEDTADGWEYLGNARTLDLLERTLVWWRAAVERKRDACGRERLTATGVSGAALDALVSNRVVIHPDTLAAERAERARQRKRDRAERDAWSDRWQGWCDRGAA